MAPLPNKFWDRPRKPKPRRRPKAPLPKPPLWPKVHTGTFNTTNPCMEIPLGLAQLCSLEPKPLKTKLTVFKQREPTPLTADFKLPDKWGDFKP
jgi:hypothetical protein